VNHAQATEKIIGQILRTGELFPEDSPLARQKDPWTSKLGAVRYSGKRREGDKERMRDLIRRYPGHTAAEFSAILITNGMNWYKAARMPTKRIADIKHELVLGPARLCKITNEYANTYYMRSEYL